MNKYNYSAINELGKKVHGKIEAQDKDAAFIALRKQFPTVTSVEEPGALDGLMDMDVGSKKIKPSKLSLLCSQYAIILKSGTPVGDATKLLAEQQKDKKLKKLLDAVYSDILAGRDISAAFERNANGAVPPTFFATLRAGEGTGQLDDSFKKLAEYFDKQAKIATKIKTAMAYPIFVLVIAVIVVAVVMVYAMPKLAEVFSEFGSDLPGITRLLISVSDFFGKYWYIVLGIILLIIVAFKVIRHFPGGRQELDRLKLKMPIFGVLTTASCSADFASTLVILLRAGVNLSDALSTVASTIKNSYYSMATEKLSDALAKGTPISYEMTKYECFPPVLTQMVYVGEDSNIEETLSTIGDYYADESERISNSLAAKLEPVMLVGIAFIACFIVFGIYLPMFQMYDLFG